MKRWQILGVELLWGFLIIGFVPLKTTITSEEFCMPPSLSSDDESEDSYDLPTNFSSDSFFPDWFSNSDEIPSDVLGSVFVIVMVGAWIIVLGTLGIRKIFQK
jgi:hypothetical protein